MISVHDLCVGNWVYDGNHTKFPMQITSLAEGYVTMSFPSNEGMDWESEPNELMGIPITEGLLAKMGFNKVTKIRWGKAEEDKIIEVVFWPDGKIQVQIHTLIYANRDFSDHWHIRYLHELQNLFWNITKQQLKVNL